ncbi:MAG: DUF1552 domain-containing protein [Myxococcales bacterium]|nr:DUF1552 domain-containing protein [Myxococcales bacterium]
MTSPPPSSPPRRTVSRRGFMAGLGLTAVAAPFVRMLTDVPRARAAAGATAKRLVVVFTPNGTIPARWRPTGSGAAFSFPAGSILEPLAAQRERLIVVDGLQFVGATNHEGGMAAMLTGSGDAGSESRGMSVDQYVAAAIGGATRLRSLELGVETSAWGGSVQTRMSYSGPGQYAPPDDSPKSVYARLYGDAAPGGADATLARRQSVLDALKGDLGDLRTRLGAEEAHKLDQHLTSLRELERGLGGGTCSGGMTVPDVPIHDNASFPVIGKAQMDLLVAALACGATNVASLQWAHTVSPHVLTWAGVSDAHHALSHMDDGNAAGVAAFVAAERWFASQFGYLVDKLAATPDPAGGTLLDSTLVVWAKEMGDSRAHVCTDVPFVLTGGGVFTPGRYLRTGGASHARLLVSICQAMGLSTTTFGNPQTGTGPLAGL